ncbi:MAG TPA: methyltransferase [Bryobacteraceae bacterium]|nr:methyltransferase [Bryobacteraceae bacterium]
MAGADDAAGDAAHKNELTQMAMGYFRSRALSAAARLGVADALGDGSRSLGDLAAACNAQPASLHRLLRALASFGVIAETTPCHFILTPFGQPLRKDDPNSEWASVVFWSDLLADSWSYLADCVRNGEAAGRIMQREGVASRWSKDPDARSIFGAVMGTAPAEQYEPIVRAWGDFLNHRTVADLGGGGGGLITTILNAYPGLHGVLVDRPEFIDKAAARLEREGLAGRCRLVGADLLRGVPAGADVYLLKHVLHGYADEAVIQILTHCRSVVPAGGRLLVIEFVLPGVVNNADTELELRLMSDLNMLVVTGGKERSASEWRNLLTGASFECQRIIPVSGDLVSIIEAA